MKTSSLKPLAFLLVFLFAQTSQTAYAQWVQQPSGTTDYLRYITFTDANNGYIVGSGSIIQTKDGGRSWSATKPTLKSKSLSSATDISKEELIQMRKKHRTTSKIVVDEYTRTADTLRITNLNPADSSLYVSFILKPTYYINNSTIGIRLGIKNNPSSTHKKGIILRTSDAGLTWQVEEHENILNNIDFVNSTTGFIVGEKGAILKTIDAGAHWIKQNSGVEQSLRGVDFVNQQVGYAVGGNGGALILKTTDGGENWITQTTSVIYYLSSVAFENESLGYAVGGRGTILYTQNGGQNWEIQNSNTTGDLNAISISDNGAKCIVGENGLILYNNKSSR